MKMPKRVAIKVGIALMEPRNGHSHGIAFESTFTAEEKDQGK